MVSAFAFVVIVLLGSLASGGTAICIPLSYVVYNPLSVVDSGRLLDISMQLSHISIILLSRTQLRRTNNLAFTVFIL